MRETLLFILLLFSGSTYAQEVISTSGKAYSNSNGQLYWTIGEPVIYTMQNTSNAATQGFHQTQLEVSAIEDEDFEPDVSIYPNPTTSNIELQVSGHDEDLEVEVFDISGKVLEEAVFTKEMEVMDLNFENYESGSYYLRLIGFEKMKTYSIIKQ